MRNMTFVTSLGLALVLGATASAQPPRPDGPPRDRGADSTFRGRRGPGGPDGTLLRGITLTDAQRQRLDALRREQRAQTDASRGPSRGDVENGRGARERGERERGDTTGMAERRAQMDERRRREVAAIRSILTQAQRRQFDANVAEMEQQMRERSDRDGRGPRGDRQE